MKTAILAALFAFPALAEVSLSVEVGSRVEGVDAADLNGQIRDVAARTLSDDAGTISVTGDVARVDQGYLVTLELREGGKLAATASARAGSPEELGEASASAAVDLFRAWKETASIAMNPPTLGAPPGPAPLLQRAGIVSIDLDANLLVAFDEARAADTRGKENPDEAAGAWRAVAETVGPNPFREAALERSKEWQGWAEQKRAFEDQRQKDTARMRKVLPRHTALTDETRIELLTRYSRAYGPERAGRLLTLLPLSLRIEGELAIGCESKQARDCVELANSTGDAHKAVSWLGRACDAGDSGSCGEAGDRWLSKDLRDVGRAIPALETGCAAGGAKPCARLARVYEEGDGVTGDVARAASLRDRACSAGDGMSCRKLACGATDTKAATDLWDKGCKDGDSVSCTLAAASTPQPAKPAVTPAVTRVDRPNHDRAGATMVGIAVVMGTGAAILALETDDHPYHRYTTSKSVMFGGPTPGSSPRALPLALGAAAAVSAAVGVSLFFWQPDPGPGKVAVGVTPTGLVLSGSLP
jgi:hypothetical protein